MKLDIYAKHRTGKSADGRNYDFYSYTTRMVKKDGEVVTAQVKFSNCDAPEGSSCPCSIEVDKKSMNMAIDNYEKRNEAGEITEVCSKFILWVKAYTMAEFVDHSLDDFVTD